MLAVLRCSRYPAPDAPSALLEPPVFELAVNEVLQVTGEEDEAGVVLAAKLVAALRAEGDAVLDAGKAEVGQALLLEEVELAG